MRFLTRKEAEALLGGELEQHFGSFEGGHSEVYSIPKDAGKKTALAGRLSTMILERGAALLWIRNCGIFPSCENWDLFDGYRRSLGEHRPIQDSPVHLFNDEEDRLQMSSLLSLALYFFWDAEVASLSGDLAISFSHDEWMETSLVSAEAADKFSRFVALEKA